MKKVMRIVRIDPPNNCASSYRNPKRKDVTRICLLLTYLQNGIMKSWQRIPSLTAMFVAKASFILLDPSNEHYSSLILFQSFTGISFNLVGEIYGVCVFS